MTLRVAATYVSLFPHRSMRAFSMQRHAWTQTGDLARLRRSAQWRQKETEQRLDGPECGALFRRAWVTTRTDIDAPINYRKQKHVLFGRQEGRCGGCRHDFPFRNFTVDHVTPRSRSGTDHLDNLQLLCGACNSVKGDRTQEYLLARLSECAA